jgi:hypothetical protein
MKVLVCCGYASGVICPFVGQYLKQYDPNGDIRGAIGEWTDDPTQALTFPTVVEAMECWKQERTVGPHLRRGDGKPDRPLTAYSVEILSLEEVAHG